MLGVATLVEPHELASAQRAQTAGVKLLSDQLQLGYDDVQVV
ncbi:hypothetical protein HaLaN_26563, partial [Haematococcus lacustris]